MGSILLVEDDPDIRELVGELLVTEGYDVVQAANGQEALDYLLDHAAPSLILLDLMMPVLSGAELIEILQQTSSLARIPVVVVSAMADHGAVVGVGRFLRKPISSDLLLQVVAEHCADSEGRRRHAARATL